MVDAVERPEDVIRRAAERAAAEYGPAWVDQPWQDFIADFTGEPIAAEFIRECDPESVAALAARAALADRYREALEEIAEARLYIGTEEWALLDAEEAFAEVQRIARAAVAAAGRGSQDTDRETRQ